MDFGEWTYEGERKSKRQVAIDENLTRKKQERMIVRKKVDVLCINTGGTAVRNRPESVKKAFSVFLCKY
ncbi:MAG: hypothetical protein E7353_05145 [Clostridiales bacterium]|nr:hypothetical protein [Clostridiales bacterium]